ncbi:MAG: hypothetical protein JO249_24520 [Acidobacteria bacterium]|nr:hypothetical protein [Acidobacteriota bacterium]MBV9483885.1 hypothetical protein [Acidobacteriota bacterium]
MKTLIVGLMLFSIPGFRMAPPRHLVGTAAVAQVRRGGRWYLAESGHAVYCRGPVITVAMGDGSMRKVATYCQGSHPLVPLKE